MSNAINLPIFSPEIFDTIIDYARDDRRCMSTCALVCRSWITRSRFHLFETIYLKRGPTVHNGGNFTSFLRLLDSPHSSFVPHVLSVSLEMPFDQGETLTDDEETVLRRLSDLIAPRTFENLLRIVRFGQSTELTTSIILMTFRNVTHLEISEPFDMFLRRDMFLIFPFFPHVEKLSVYPRTMGGATSDDYGNHDVRLFPKLRSLLFTSDIYIESLSWILHYGWQKVSELAVHNVHDGMEMYWLLETLKFQSDSILSLDISFGPNVGTNVRENGYESRHSYVVGASSDSFVFHRLLFGDRFFSP